MIDGFSLHANVHILENDRLGLERLLSYAGRAPIALERLSWGGDGTLLYRTKRTSKRGEPRVLQLTPLELLRKLAADSGEADHAFRLKPITRTDMAIARA